MSCPVPPSAQPCPSAGPAGSTALLCSATPAASSPRTCSAGLGAAHPTPLAAESAKGLSWVSAPDGARRAEPVAQGARPLFAASELRERVLG